MAKLMDEASLDLWTERYTFIGAIVGGIAYGETFVVFRIMLCDLIL